MRIYESTLCGAFSASLLLVAWGIWVGGYHPEIMNWVWGAAGEGAIPHGFLIKNTAL